MKWVAFFYIYKINLVLARAYNFKNKRQAFLNVIKYTIIANLNIYNNLYRIANYSEFFFSIMFKYHIHSLFSKLKAEFIKINYY